MLVERCGLGPSPPAAVVHHLKALKLVLEAGADSNTRCANGIGPLRYALNGHAVKAMGPLIDAGATLLPYKRPAKPIAGSEEHRGQDCDDFCAAVRRGCCPFPVAMIAKTPPGMTTSNPFTMSVEQLERVMDSAPEGGVRKPGQTCPGCRATISQAALAMITKMGLTLAGTGSGMKAACAHILVLFQLLDRRGYLGVELLQRGDLTEAQKDAYNSGRLPKAVATATGLSVEPARFALPPVYQFACFIAMWLGRVPAPITSTMVECMELACAAAARHYSLPQSPGGTTYLNDRSMGQFMPSTPIQRAVEALLSAQTEVSVAVTTSPDKRNAVQRHMAEVVPRAVAAILRRKPEDLKFHREGSSCLILS